MPLAKVNTHLQAKHATLTYSGMNYLSPVTVEECYIFKVWFTVNEMVNCDYSLVRQLYFLNKFIFIYFLFHFG